jgi:hypothetical protein
VHHIELSQRGFDGRVFMLRNTQDCLLGPVAAGFPRTIAATAAEDEIMVQDPEDTILQGRPLLDQTGPVGHLLTKRPRAVAGKAYPSQNEARRQHNTNEFALSAPPGSQR